RSRLALPAWLKEPSMPSTDQTARVYRELADEYERRGDAPMRDRFLVLAADAALSAGRPQEAEELRGRLLRHNPHHLLNPYFSFAEAAESADVGNYLNALRRNHPADKAEQTLASFKGRGSGVAAAGSRAPSKPAAGGGVEETTIIPLQQSPAPSGPLPPRPPT